MPSTRTARPSSVTAKPGALSRFQKFQAVTLQRNQLKKAPYNPRTIDDHARKKLAESLRGFGLVEPLIWNKRTGNLVGGHQRLSILDDLEGRADYALTVAAVDLDDKEERELNIQLNNPNVAGDWDLDGLAELLKGDVDVERTGFDKVDLQLMFEDDVLASIFAEDAAAPVIADLAGQAADIEAIKARKKEAKQIVNNADDPEFSVMLVFNDRVEVQAFCKLTGQPVERYLNGRAVVSFIEALQKG